MLCIDNMKSYEENLLNETTYISTVKEIHNNLMTMGEIYTKQTAHDKLDLFKKCMYYCSFASSNLFFLVSAQNELHLSDELIYIHELMFKFLCEKHKFLKFNIFRNISSKYDPSSFSWRIPKIFMPILTSYILATAFIKKEHTTIDFFSKMDKYFNSSLNICDGYTKEIYKEWTNQYLGREYFSHLDNIYKEYAKNSQEQTIIRDSFCSLTKLVVEAPARPNMVSAQMCSVLVHYEMSLKKHTDLATLYPHNEPFKIISKSELIKFLEDTMLQSPNNLLSFLENSLNINSRYKIAVDNFDLFKEDLNRYIKDIEFQIDKTSEEIIISYSSKKNDPDIVKAVKENRLIFYDDNFYKYIECLDTRISKYKDELTKKINTFIKKVEQASNPKKDSSLRLGTDYFKELKEDIDYKRKLFIQKVNDDFDKLKLSPFVLLHKKGYIKENLSYPQTLFWENDILRLTYALTNNYYYLSEEHIINHFKDKGLIFPMPRYQVISFLLDFDQMIDGL